MVSATKPLLLLALTLCTTNAVPFAKQDSAKGSRNRRFSRGISIHHKFYKNSFAKRQSDSCSFTTSLTGSASSDCNTAHDSSCCSVNKEYPQYHCSPPVTSNTSATLTLNGFGEGEDGGGASACDDKFHSNDELVVALSTGWFDGGSRCGKLITISANGKSVQAKVVDECDSVNGCDSEHAYQPPCDNNIVDASNKVWELLGIDSSNENYGMMSVSWTDGESFSKGSDSSASEGSAQLTDGSGDENSNENDEVDGSDNDDARTTADSEDENGNDTDGDDGSNNEDAQATDDSGDENGNDADGDGGSNDEDVSSSNVDASNSNNNGTSSSSGGGADGVPGTTATLTLNSFAAGGDGGGPSSCDGQYHSDSDPIVALSTGWFANGQRCLRRITIYANGKSVQATVVDECDISAGCKSDIVDGSQAVWNALGLDTNVGEATVTWTD